MQPDFSLSRKKLPRNILRKRLKNFHKKNALIRPEKTLGMSCGRGCVWGGLRGGRRRRVVAELLDGGVNRAAEAQRQGGGLSRSCGTAEGCEARLRREEVEGGGADFFQCRGLNYPRKIRRMGVKNIEKLESEFRQFLVKTQKIANEIFEVLGKFSRSQSKFGIAWTKFKVVSGLRPRPPVEPPKKRRVSAPALKVGVT